MSDRRPVFGYHIGLCLLVWALFLVPLTGITVLLMFNPPKDPGDEIAIVFLYLLFSGISLPLLWEMTWWRLEVTDEGLACRSPWRGSWTIPWDDVKRLGWSQTAMWFIVEAKRGWWFRFSYLIAGRDRLLAELERRLMPEQMEGAEAGYLYIRRPFPYRRRPIPVSEPASRRQQVPGIDLSKWGDRRR
jgi:hypothetical protein